MKIDLHNAEVINTKKVYLHDGILTNMVFNRASKCLTLEIEFEKEEQNVVRMDLLNVACFEMTACDFWGPSPHILDFEYMKEGECLLIPKLKRELEEIKENIMLKHNFKKLIETRMTFTSGDRLTIVCEEILMQYSQ